MAIQDNIQATIEKAEPGELFFINDFGEYENAYVSKILSLLVSYHILERLAKGLYYKPIITKYGTVYPSTDKIVKAIAKHDHAEILPAGESALNALGLSTQVPMKPVYLTTGSQRIITVGNKTIKLIRRVPGGYAYQSKLMPILSLALRTIGQKNITEVESNKIRELINRSSESELIRKDLLIAPVWIKKFIKQLENNNSHEPVDK